MDSVVDTSRGGNGCGLGTGRSMRRLDYRGSRGRGGGLFNLSARDFGSLDTTAVNNGGGGADMGWALSDDNTGSGAGGGRGNLDPSGSISSCRRGTTTVGDGQGNGGI